MIYVHVIASVFNRIVQMGSSFLLVGSGFSQLLNQMGFETIYQFILLWRMCQCHETCIVHTSKIFCGIDISILLLLLAFC